MSDNDSGYYGPPQDRRSLERDATGAHWGEVVPREQAPIELRTRVIQQPEPKRRNRLLPVVLVLGAVVLVLAGVVIGVVVSSRSTPPRQPAPIAAPTPANVVPTAAPAATTAPRATTAPAGPSTDSATRTGLVPVVPVLERTEQLRVTPDGQNLDNVVDSGDDGTDFYFSADADEHRFHYETARWTAAQPPTAQDCALQLRQQPLSDSERGNLLNNPPPAVCTYTSAGNIAFVKSLGPADGEGVQVTVAVWQL